jgi:Ca2+-binding EF-hand superfamily protein
MISDDAALNRMLSPELLKRIPQLQQLDLASHRKAFDILDTNSDQKIQQAECSPIFELLHLPLHRAPFASAFSELDKDSSGTLSFTEYLEAVQHGKSFEATLIMASMNEEHLRSGKYGGRDNVHFDTTAKLEL